MFFDGWKFITCDGFPKWAKGFQKENKTVYLENIFTNQAILLQKKGDFNGVISFFYVK